MNKGTVLAYSRIFSITIRYDSERQDSMHWWRIPKCLNRNFGSNCHSYCGRVGSIPEGDILDRLNYSIGPRAGSCLRLTTEAIWNVHDQWRLPPINRSSIWSFPDWYRLRKLLGIWGFLSFPPAHVIPQKLGKFVCCFESCFRCKQSDFLVHYIIRYLQWVFNTLSLDPCSQRF